jgi:hypothetical protein
VGRPLFLLFYLVEKRGVLTFRAKFFHKKRQNILVFHNKVLILPLIVKTTRQKGQYSHEEIDDMDIDGCNGDSPAGTARHADHVS